ncbi:MAG: DUF4178 domain-containing protein [Deltaproteobacteria bacterium]|nr:DUF4178 domain-containing protein [Deltaproteobacteria bacterium]
MKLSLRDIVSHQGRDYTVEGVLTYKLGGKTYPLGRIVDGNDVVYFEPLMDDLDDRVLMLREVTDLQIAPPPPDSVSYNGQSFVRRLSGTATVSITGKCPGRDAGACEVWRFRAAGDLFLQVEKWPDKVVALAGESIHKGMIDVLPAT